jgi:hypothetical protein
MWVPLTQILPQSLTRLATQSPDDPFGPTDLTIGETIPPAWAERQSSRVRSHGTGHGVGSFLNVHEGPQGIGPRPAYNEVPLQAGMVISNEPGYYADGKWGIRIENIIVVKIAETPNNFGGKGYLEFEHVTMVGLLCGRNDPCHSEWEIR